MGGLHSEWSFDSGVRFLFSVSRFLDCSMLCATDAHFCGGRVRSVRGYRRETFLWICRSFVGCIERVRVRVKWERIIQGIID